MKKKKILVAMSGGVDSSVAAYLLKKQGHEIAGVFLKFWKEKNTAENSCCSLESFNEAKLVAASLAMPLFSFDFTTVFKKEVVDYFLNSYQRGSTPNPCIVCNKKVKLGLLLKKAKSLGYDYLASGHYAKVINKKLYKAKDETKDQSYFLYTLSEQELKFMLFPLANLLKTQVREIAKEANLVNYSKSDSQDICFIDGDHNDFLKRHLKLKKGPIVNQATKKVIGEHKGLALYTIGQRKGLDIGGSGPYYVYKLDYNKNTLWVTSNWNDQLLYKDSFKLKNLHLINSDLKTPFRCEVVIRYGHQGIKALVSANREVKLEKPTRAITSGQSAVFYRNKRVIGGGVIA
jgi:tRNA-uridine 2-sulfurtransferase